MWPQCPLTSKEAFTSSTEPTKHFLGIVLFNFKMHFFVLDQQITIFESLWVSGKDHSFLSLCFFKKQGKGSSASQHTSLGLGSVAPELI